PNFRRRESNLKLKVGRDVIHDIKCIEFIRRELKFPNEIRIDANQGYSLKQLQYIIPTLKEYGVTYVEEPVKIKDLPVAAELLHHYGLKVILDESLNIVRSDLGARLPARQVRQGRTFSDYDIDAINIKLSRIGNIKEALRLIKLAKKHNIKVVIGCSEELEKGMKAIYALGQEAEKLEVLLEVEGFGPLRLKRRAMAIPRWMNRLENLVLIIGHRLSTAAFDLWWEMARIPVILLKQSKKLSSLSLRLIELTGKYPGRMHPKHLLSGVEPQYLKWLSTDDSVLDVGCGNGQHTLKAAAKVRRTVGFDTDMKQLKLAEAAAGRSGRSNAEFRKLSAEGKLPFSSGEFSAVLFLGVLEHLDKREGIIKEVVRVLKPGGKLLLGVPNEQTSWKRLQMRFGISHYTDPDHRIEYSMNDIRKFLEENGFSILKIEPTAYDTPWAGIIDLIGGISLGWYRKLIEWKWKKVKYHPEETISFFIVASKVK
ncbi:methyltransferase domain-containing protein, partial [Candidatus Jorgensenbacteria bacterium]|nr:methyltransferase domain-containing protein [Candidatus Jorgensenbacteria bacterium]